MDKKARADDCSCCESEGYEVDKSRIFSENKNCRDLPKNADPDEECDDKDRSTFLEAGENICQRDPRKNADRY